MISSTYILKYPTKATPTIEWMGDAVDQGVIKSEEILYDNHDEDIHSLIPITFTRQVLACVTLPELIEHGDIPEDVRLRAREILDSCGSVGCYTENCGMDYVRRHVAEYIERRDGHPAVIDDIYLSCGTTSVIINCLKMFRNNRGGKPSGVLVPTPRHPLYSSFMTELGLKEVEYHVSTGDWGVDVEKLRIMYKEASKKCEVRAIVLINPGLHSGQILQHENIEEVIKFAYEHSLFVIADEVMQDSCYDKGKFVSVKKVVKESEAPYNMTELASFMSLSKSFSGEAGLRGGWVEFLNLDPAINKYFYKLVTISGCPNSLGQVALDCMVCPPKPGQPSYEQWMKENTHNSDILCSLGRGRKC